MRSPTSDLDLPARPGESFTARTLRLRVRAVNTEPEAQPEPQPFPATDDPEPEPPASAPGMLLVRLQAETTLPAADADDSMTSECGLFVAPRFGIAGTIEAIAGDAPGFNVGDAVFGLTSTPPCRGTDQLAVVEGCRMAKMPSRLSFSEAALSALTGTSAWQMLFKIGRLDAGETVLILGADTPIGAFAVQLAAVHGVRTIAMVTSLGSGGELLMRGAHRVLDAGPGRLEAQCRIASLVVDTLGGAPHRRAAASLQPGCTLVSCVERPDVFTAARRGTRSLFCVPDATTHCLARIATLIDEQHVTTRTVDRELGRE